MRLIFDIYSPILWIGENLQKIMNHNGKVILHVDMDAFFVSVEEVLNPRLRGKPVIVGGDPNGRGVVSSASYKAREYGVRSAMPMKKAKRLCPKGIFIRGSHHLYAEYSHRIMEVLGRYTPALEVVSVDEAYLDITGCLRLHKADPVTLAQRIREHIKSEVGTPCSIGVGSNKLIAKIAANLAKPNGILYVRPGHEASILAPLSIEKMPGVGPSAAKELRMLGIRRIGDLTNIPADALERVFGRRGSDMVARARGFGAERIETRAETKSMGREVTFAVDTADKDQLEATLSYLSESVGRRARKAGFSFQRVTIKLRYEDFHTYTRSRVIERPTSGTATLFRVARELLRALLSRRSRVRLIGVSVSLLTAPERQMDIFKDAPGLCHARLDLGMDVARERFGFGSVMLARSYLSDMRRKTGV